jgi:hypothetical protein
MLRAETNLIGPFKKVLFFVERMKAVFFFKIRQKIHRRSIALLRE